MNKIKVHHYDAFSTIPNMGNPAGVVLDADTLSEREMQEIALKVGFNETAFVMNSDRADLRIRYFTPGHEINLCGHATMASLYCLKSKGFLEGRDSLLIETEVGQLPIDFSQTQDNTLLITMKQDTPEFMPFKGDVGKLAESIGITAEEIDQNLPVFYGSTGIWTLLVPIKNWIVSSE
ncbi:isomerase [Effusibacillus lacus]|uniref:Isomerase n=1 Tax=Effusibacillus lacus TaxID=1348429 RepID=A0A292YNY3_9BACL|nr:PhzF family phenazine biosynthesis protein [Effusibacillus lacus]GAX90195.1 isomerase [Effusibacillus lacus]